jgi:two-component system sensor histidine kinase TctE
MTTRLAEPGSRFGIRARLLALLLPCILGLLALDSWNDYRALRDLVQDSYDRVMLASVNALRSNVSHGPDGVLRLASTSRLAGTVLDAAAPEDSYLHVGLTPRPGAQGATAPPPRERMLLGEADLPPPPATNTAQVAGTPVWYDADYRGRPVRVVALRSQVVDGRGQPFDLLIQAAESTGPRDRARADSLQQQLFRDARMVLVVIVLVWLGVTWSLKPLERLRESVVRNRGQVPEPLDARGVPHEVAPLVDAVNQHVASHRDLLDAQSQFLADASHQLRTPLAIMLTQAGVALREKDPAQRQETLHAMLAQISRSRRLCEQLLSLAHASERALANAPAMADINSIAREVVLQHLTLAHEKDQDLGWVDAGHAVAVQANGAELHEALANLVHNAIVYTPAGGSITVKVGTADGMALAEVCDDGPGIAPSRRAEVFERFRQIGDRAGVRGAGLGLAIARAYARRNGGDIALADVDAGTHGLRAVLRLPSS